MLPHDFPKNSVLHHTQAKWAHVQLVQLVQLVQGIPLSRPTSKKFAQGLGTQPLGSTFPLKHGWLPKAPWVFFRWLHASNMNFTEPRMSFLVLHVILAIVHLDCEMCPTHMALCLWTKELLPTSQGTLPSPPMNQGTMRPLSKPTSPSLLQLGRPLYEVVFLVTMLN